MRIGPDGGASEPVAPPKPKHAAPGAEEKRTREHGRPSGDPCPLGRDGLTLRSADVASLCAAGAIP
jgi:hypothetical protein